MIKRLLIGTAAGALGAAFVTGAYAQAANDTELEQVVVTAQRREQSAQDVGIALSVISGDQLAARGVTNVNQLQYQTPSLEIVPAFGGGQPQFHLRGVGFDDYATNNTPTVGVYVDEVAYPVPAATQGVLYDIDRVEVLRGPQGTLYGRNTTGGAINFITRRPTDQLSAGVTAEYGRFDSAKVEGFVSGPLGQTLKGRLSAVTEQGGAWQRNRATGEKLGDADRSAVRGQLDWSPTDKVDVLLNAHYGQDKSDGQGLYLLNVPGQVGDTRHNATGWGVSSTFAALAGAAPGAKPQRDNKSGGGSITASIDLGFAKLTSISAYENLKRRELNDWDAKPRSESDTFWGSDVDVYSQEVRLASKSAGPLTWLAGGYYSHQTLNETFLTDFTQSLGFITNTSYRQKVESISGFGQLEYALTPRLKTILGLRYEHEERDLENFATKIGGAPLFNNGDRHTSLNELSGKAGVEFQADENVLLYANVSRGVKSGGFTVYNSPQSDQINAFKPEVLWAYEAGFKGDLARNLRLNGSVFYYDYRDQQVLGVVINPTNGAIGRITNAPKSEIYGGELELQWTPFHGLQITQTASYKKGSYRTFDDVDASSVVKDPVSGLWTGQTIDKSGVALDFPRISYGGAVSYIWAIGDFDVQAATDYAYRDEAPSFLGAEYTVASYWLANANLTIQPKDGPWSLGLWGRNVFNEKYDVTRNYFLTSAKIGAAGRPATYGVRASYAF
ncbi:MULTISPECIES: TonB-dependent receptor [unclassified Caulobacter]|uniref:TonB-dependent receptor n=1 Tax=unclassified Caulobacter TaxID=2648921 RepID=UPI0006F72B57|nr:MULTISPECIES: TonB-dependent receptor [unclassified Caulobacter]KQV56786.1 TonB-dependent receptor [Caulobacter sp. Root342]KQV72425.1 TonB-dependent receptor [Caulobacter sp. Root343]